LPEDATVDKSYLAIAYPLVEEADSIEESTSDDDFFLAYTLGGPILPTTITR